MGSEDQVLELMVLLDTGYDQSNKIEEKLTEYERKLQVECVLCNRFNYLHIFYLELLQPEICLPFLV